MDKFMLWIDEHLNHGFVEPIISNVFGYRIWSLTSRKFCLWICDNFETFEE